MPVGQPSVSVLLVEDHHEMRTALRDWLLASFSPLRLSEARSASNVVLMSANDSDALRIAAIDAGAVAFIRKRELTASLLPIVSRVLSGKSLPQVAQ